ncbi:borealin [Struthio camelus]|uniref:borealin n=1 Tax=Struthio camelus TaxID=8801 RepID=UPI0036042880
MAAAVPSRRMRLVAHDRRLAIFLRDFDREVKMPLERLRTDGERLVREMEELYDLELPWLPQAVRSMNWLIYFAKGESAVALEGATVVDVWV